MSIIKEKLREVNYKFREPIELITGRTVMVNSYAKWSEKTCDEKLRAGADSPPKFSACAIFLDQIFLHNRISALASDNDIYGEYHDGTNYIRFVCDGKTATYEGERLQGNLTMVPFILYAMKKVEPIGFELAATELKKAFAELRDAIEKGKGPEEIETNIALFCDVYHYGFVRPQNFFEVKIQENTLNMSELQQKIVDGDYSKFEPFEGMNTPKMTGVDTNSAKKGKAARPSGEDFFTCIKNGDYDIPYAWDEKQSARIPSKDTLESFVPSPTFYSLVSKVKSRLDKVLLRMDSGLDNVAAIGKDHVEVFITGKPGTGKTTLAYALGAATNMPVYTIAMTKNTEEDVFQGMNKVVDGALKFVPTDFLEAYTNGGIIILEEINLPDPSVVMGSIGQAVEFPFTLMKDGYIPVKRHPMCVIIGTMNIGTFGSKGVNQALSSRFRQSYVLNDPTKEDFIRILTNTGAKRREANWVFTAYQKITDYLKSPSVNAEDVCMNVTLRGCLGALENMSEGETAKEAIRNTLVGKISEVDLALAEDVYKNVVQSLPEL